MTVAAEDRSSGRPPGDEALLERERELASLDTLIERATAGGAAVCAIEGSAGIGKTGLVRQVRARAAENGMTVLSASGSELEREFGFGVVGQLFARTARGEQAQLLAGAAAAAAPIVGREGGQEPGEQAVNPSFASLDALYWLTVRLCEQRSLLLAIDDLQWCDAPSLRYLTYLRSRFEGLPLLVVCGVRTADRGVDAAMDVLLGDPATVHLHPRALSEAASSVLIERRLRAVPDHAFTAACHRTTGGNPLMLDELVKALADEGARPDEAHLPLLKDLGPDSVSRMVLLRLRRLGAEATGVAQALAVLGAGADLARVAALAGLDIEPAGRAMAALARAEIVQAEPSLGFVHPLVAAAVYRDVLPGEREVRHLRAAELLAAASAPTEQVAGHLLPAPACGAEWVVEQLARAAAGASRRGAADSAVVYLRRALAEPPVPQRRAELSLALGRAELLRDGTAAVENLRAAYALLSEPEQRAAAADALCRALLFTGEGDEAVRLAQDMATSLPERLTDQRQQFEAFALFCVLFGAGDPDELRRLERYRTKPAGDGVGARMLSALAAQAWMYAGGPSDAVSELSLAALSDGVLIAHDSGWAATFPITNLAYADREEAEGWWEAARTAAHRRGSLLDIAAFTQWHGNALHRRGELVDAEQSVRSCLTAVHEWGYQDVVARIYCDALLAAVLLDRGYLPAARRALAHSADTGRDDEGTRHWLGRQVELLVAEGSFESAISAADDYAGRFDHIVPNPVDVPWRSLKALALHRLGRRGPAVELVGAELELARVWGAPGTLARTLRVLGTIEEADGLAHLEEAAAVVAGSPARLEHARSLAAVGGALRRARRPADARAPLRQALELASVCGAEKLAEHVRSELYAAGGRPRRTAISGVDAFTARERRVVSIAAEGATNREVGEALFITPKTVAMHLSNAYRKLGITSRNELPDALADTPLGP